MDEADRLCHRVAIIDKGRLAAIDTPAALRRRVESRRSVEVRFAQYEGDATVFAAELRGAEMIAMADGFRAYTPHPGALAQAIAARASALGMRITSISTLAPTLEDVFLSITSHAQADTERRGTQ
jgi:ABC-2 type transport system ATP-binding protein